MTQTIQRLRILFIRLTGILLIYSLLRVLFTVTYFGHLKGESLQDVLLLFLYGLRYDLSVICILNSVFILCSFLPLNFTDNKYFQRLLLGLFLLVNSVGLAVAIADIGYFRYSNRRMTSSIFNFLSRKEDSWGLFFTFLKDFWYLFALFILAVVYLYILFTRAKGDKRIVPLRQKDYVTATGALFLIACLSVVAIRGGLQNKPLKMIMAGYYCKAPAIPFVLNTPYTLIETFSESALQEPAYLPPATAREYYNGVKPAAHPAAPDFAGKNVVVVILESFSREYTSLNGDQSWTPFLDSLMDRSLVMTNAYANGKQSIEGIPAILASLPSWFNQDYLTSSYGTNKINSIGSLLKQQGYTCSFYHGGKNGTMNFIDFIKLADAGDYYGLNEYPDPSDFDGNWGIWDEPYLQYFAKQIGEMPQPFCTSIFTLSSHNPFKVPERYKDVFNDPGLPILKSVRYTDHALKLFFDTIKTQPWFKNTLFVFTADHTGLPNSSFNEMPVGNYQIPIFFYSPDNSLQGRDSSIFQQVDIMPTLMDMLHIPTPYFAFGNSLYDDSALRFALYNVEKTAHFISSDTLIQFNGEAVTGVYDLKTDRFLRRNLLPYIPETPATLMKSVIQTYNDALIRNKTIPELAYRPKP